MAVRKKTAPGREGPAKRAPAPRKSKRRLLTGLSTDWYWEQDAQFRFTRIEVQTATPGEQELARRSLGKRQWETGTEVQGGWDAYKALLKARAPFRDFLIWRDFEDGSRRYISLSGEPTFDAKGRFTGYRGVGRDITEQKRPELLLRLQHTVTRRLGEATNFTEGIESALRAICETEGWDCGELWRLDEAAGVMRRYAHWSVPGVAAAQKFAEVSDGFEFKPGQGLVGTVWQSGESLWIPDATQDPRAARKSLAEDTGLRGALLCPVAMGKRVVGVLNFVCREIRPPDEALLQALMALASQLGGYLRRADIEVRLRQSEERFRNTFELAGVGVAHVGLDQRFLRINPRICEMFGYREEELIGLSLRDLSHPEDRDLIDSQRDRLYAGEVEAVRMEKRYLRKDGSAVWVAVSVAFVRDAAGKPLYAILVLDDISARKAAQDAVRESEARFRAVVDSANEGILVYDRALNIIAGNAAASRIIGLPLEQLIGKPGFTSLFPCVQEDGSPLTPEDRPTRVTTRTGQPATGVIIGLVRPGGEITWLSVNTGFLRRSDEAEHYGIVSTISDITRRKRGEQLLRLEHKVTLLVAQAAGAGEAIEATIHAICESENWDCGRYLRVDETAGVLRFGEAWSMPGAEIEAYIEDSRSVVYAPGVGLAGTVWQSGEPLWIADISGDSRVARKALARETGMRGAFVVPVISEGRTIGVFIFQSREIREPDQRLLHAVHVIGGQIGQLVQRTRAEQALREGEARFRSLTELSSDFFWEQDSEYRFTRLEGRNVAAGDPGPTGRLIGTRRWDDGRAIEGGWEAHRALLDARQPFFDALMWRTVADGSVRYVSVTGEPLFDAGGKFSGYRGVGRDVTEEKRAELLLRLEHSVARTLSEANDAITGVTAVMRLVCEAENWGCGRYFEVDRAADELVYRHGWNLPGTAFKEFLNGSQGLRFKSGQGLAGRAWQSGEPIWSTDTSSDPRVMAKALTGTAARGAFVFGVIAEGQTFGLLSFTSQEVRKPDERLLETTRVIGSQVGQFLRRMKAEESLRESESRFRSLTEMSSDFFWESDTQHRLVDLVHGPGYTGKMGRTIGTALWELPSTHPDAAGWAAIRATMDAHRPLRDVEFGRPGDDGTVRHFSVSGEPDFAADGSFAGYRGVGRDITEVSLARERIASLAYHDALTGLANRTSLAPALEQAVERTKRRGSKLAGLFIDLDGFKQINDLYGHDAGDRLLAEVARRLRGSLRASDPLARLGGDEFFVVLEGDLTDTSPIERVAKKLLAAILAPYDIAGGKEARISASIGISIFPDDAGDAPTLMKHADMAMYAAKQAGKNSYRLFTAGSAANDARPVGQESKTRA